MIAVSCIGALSGCWCSLVAPPTLLTGIMKKVSQPWLWFIGLWPAPFSHSDVNLTFAITIILLMAKINSFPEKIHTFETIKYCGWEMINEYPKHCVAKGQRTWQRWTTLPDHMEQPDQVQGSKSSEFLLGWERGLCWASCWASKPASLPSHKLCIVHHQEKETKLEFADHVQWLAWIKIYFLLNLDEGCLLWIRSIQQNQF